ncbi:MAG: DNA alkylation repair protein [Candidatus Gastranaerophilaceae bacterium]
MSINKLDNVMDIIEIKNRLSKIRRTSFGISIPELRKFAKEIAKCRYNVFLDNNPLDSFEMKMLHAFVIGYAKDDVEKLTDYFEKFIPYVDGWAVCDALCQSFTIARKNQKYVFNKLSKYFNSTKEFDSRVVSVMLLSHYLNDEYIDKVFTVLNTLNTEEYYSRMGVAWAVATIMGKYPKKCLCFLKNNSLDEKTYKKSLQKIRESFRVSDEIKEKIKKSY